MSKLAILIGSAEYLYEAQLPCCTNDLAALTALIQATSKYDAVRAISNATADQMKAEIRSVLDEVKTVEEIFFYFSGHGFQMAGEFFFCPKDFDAKRPYETSLSNEELHTLFRGVSPQLVVKVIDACNSGTPLIKSADGFLPSPKGGLNHVIQIASCLDSQESLTGDPLSEFTQNFCLAALRKSEGPIYYTDISNTIRDNYISNTNQIPHFTSQGTGRETFTEDARSLQAFRSEYEKTWAQGSSNAASPEGSDETTEVATYEPTLLDLLKAMEDKVAKPERVEQFINLLFDGVIEKLSDNDFADFFEAQVDEHPDFREITARSFIIRILSNESRPDNFVSATIKTKTKKRNWFETPSILALQTDEAVTETWDLELNCSMKRAQMKVSLTPKYTRLKKLVLVLTCAPSLDECYIFEIVTQHARTDWDSFDWEGQEVVRRWYKMQWNDNPSSLVNKISDKLKEAINLHLQQIKEKLAKE
ncbi:caspase family protein [Muricoccus pecuniae]|uniref:Peptidase C14 caspase domain-containing protein n=1 Tax=Muricoccus pecuniae TaxID=693023 RepID=A0A840Y355_9PROT|nr:caspase family protein [Roseomonas pecuniae]MBB5695165.1 hypothetical protein [Roseomonas pecuniae]